MDNFDFIFANHSQQYEKAKGLFKEYAMSLPITLDFQHFEEELTIVDEMYNLPQGALLLIMNNDVAIGCAGIRLLEKDICELKRMYIQPAYRKLGLSKKLMQLLLTKAIELGYHSMKLDTLKEMTPAIQLYKQFGFEEIPAYYHNPNDHVVYMEKKFK